jgi:hypothetical protein
MHRDNLEANKFRGRVTIIRTPANFELCDNARLSRLSSPEDGIRSEYPGPDPGIGRVDKHGLR